MSSEWTIPSALTDFQDIERALEGKQAAVFLDYDGTLTPIVDTPGQAVLSEEMRGMVRRLGDRCVTAVVSGRGRQGRSGTGAARQPLLRRHSRFRYLRARGVPAFTTRSGKSSSR